MNLQTIKHQVKLSEWRERVKECRSSGLSVKAWCGEQHISPQTYYRWEKEILETETAEKGLACRSNPKSAIAVPAFAEAAIPQASIVPNGWAQLANDKPMTAAGDSLVIVVGGCHITASTGTDLELLTNVCRVLRAM